MFEVTIVREFSAAHRVEEYPGNCERLHGHNWKVEVTVRREALDPLGMVVDFRKLKEQTDRVLESLDHTCLNDVPPFRGKSPTAENIAKYIFEELSKRGPVSRVDVFETESSSAAYFAE